MSSKKANKIKFGISNVYYAPITGYDEEAQKYTYGTPKHLPGAVSISLDPEGSTTKKFADNIVWYTSTTNAGYSGDLEIVELTDDFRKDILGEKEIEGVLVENSDAVVTEFALLFQINGDVFDRRIVMWRNTVERPSINGDTKEDTTEAQDDTITITTMPRENDHNVKGKILMPQEGDTDYETKKAKYDNWFKSVWEPTIADEAAAAVKQDEQESGI